MNIRTLAVATLTGAVALMITGCATPRPSQPRAAVLNEVPSYQLSTDDWMAGTTCMVYPMYGHEEHPGVNSFRGELKTALREAGYEVVEMEPYLGRAKRGRVEKLIRPIHYYPRSVLHGTNGTAHDLTVVLSVSDRPAPEEDDVSLRYFQAWARGYNGEPTRELADNFLAIDGFREALEPMSEPVEAASR